MKMPIFASLYHSGTLYVCSDSHSFRNGPSVLTLSTCFRMALRDESYFELSVCHTRSIVAGSFVCVGATGSALACESDSSGRSAKAKTSSLKGNMRRDHVCRAVSMLPPPQSKISALTYTKTKSIE